MIQSEAGDYDAATHEGIEYLFNVPFAPREYQTPEMLIRIAEMHQKLKWVTDFACFWQFFCFPFGTEMLAN